MDKPLPEADGPQTPMIGGIDPLVVTPRVWSTLLGWREDAPQAATPDGWSLDEIEAFDLYASLLLSSKEPLVFAQVGQSLDGRIGTAAGDCRDISGPNGLVHLHRLRALADVVLVGANTVLADDPRLTVRLADGPDPARAVLDPSGRVPATARIWDDGAPRLAFQSVPTERPAGVETIRLTRDEDGAIAPRTILETLAARGFRRILIEGGARTIGGFMEAGLVDRLHVSISAKIIGSGPAGFALTPISLLSSALKPETRIYGLGSDILFDCRFGS